MTDFLTRLAARTLGLGARAAPDLAPEIAGIPPSMRTVALDSEGWSIDAARARATVQQSLSETPMPRASAARSPGEMDADRPANPAPGTRAVARPSADQRPERAETVPAANERTTPIAADLPPARFIPLVKMEPDTAPIHRPDRGEQTLAHQPRASPSTLPAQALLKSPQRAGSDERNDVADGANLAQRKMPSFAEPAADRASSERVDATQAMTRDPATVRVTIGRIEVRASAAPARAEPPRKAPPPRRGISLDAYLKQRNDSR